MTDAATARGVAERVARESYGRLVAFLAARTRDLAGAEDALSEAFAAALDQWPREGAPANPDAWLLSVARRRQTDAWRRRRTQAEGEAQLTTMLEEIEAAARTPDAIPDRRLALMFACAHPAVERDMRTPLMLQAVLGLPARDIGAAFLVPPVTMSQRLVRAKARLKTAQAAFRIPETEDLPERLDAVLEAVYAAFTIGWADGEPGEADLAPEAIWLGRVIVGLIPDQPEARGALALMLYAEARRMARRTSDGDYAPLEEQNIALWDLPLIAEAETLLRQANAAGPSGRYQIEAAIQSAHVARRLHDADSWPAIIALYEVLLTLSASPVVRLNHAMATARVEGAEVALALIQPLDTDPRMAGYQPYWAARGQLCAEAGRRAEAHEALTLAIGLTADPAVRRYLQQKRGRLKAD